MIDSKMFFRIFGIKENDKKSLSKFSKKTGISVSRLKHYNNTNTLPSGKDLEIICEATSMKPIEIMLKMGRLDRKTVSLIRNNSDKIAELITPDLIAKRETTDKTELRLETSLGKLYQGDCLDFMRTMKSDGVDLIFADPPFNLNKLYPSGINDDLKESQYLEWCEEWAGECIRILKPGGSMFVWNLPKWNTAMSEYLNGRLTFRHWISVDIKSSFPISGRLYPSHYSLLYYCKGEKPSTFHPDRLPMEICPHCQGDLRDYGGYKNKMNPKGVNMTDVWFDIPTVRHAKYKKRKTANELSVRLLDRILEMSSNEHDLVFDPFGGSGVTYVVAEMKKRRWIGIEIGPVDDIVNRFETIESEKEFLRKLRDGYNNLFTDENLEKRRRNGLWTPESVRKGDKSKQLQFDMNLRAT